MLMRAALVTPLVLYALVVVAMVPMTAPPTRTGIAEDQRTGLFLMLPPVYLFLSITISSMYATWIGGWRPLPRSARGLSSGYSRPIDPGAETGLLKWATTLSPGARVRLAAATFLVACGWLALSLPYAIFLLWLRSDVYAPWEAAMFVGAAIGTLVWVAYLVFRYRSHSIR